MSFKMKVDIYCVGKMKDKAQLALFQDYLKRMKWHVTIHEITQSNTNKEGALLLEKITPNMPLIALDETGDIITSKQFASTIQKHREQHGNIAFAIGGADGHGDAVKERATQLLAFGKMTLPHMLARIVLIEQVYRAYSWLNNHPYHRD